MSKKDWVKKPSNQICIYKGSSSLLEFQNCMGAPSKWFPWHLHAEGLEEEDRASLIRLVMVDYSDKNHSVSVYANLKPREIKRLYHQIFMMVEDVSFAQKKIFRDDKRSNLGKVTNLYINRYEKDSKGVKRDYPWRIVIENGTGVAVCNLNGGQYCKKGSFKKEKSVTIYLSDAEIFMLFNEAVTVIRACEREHLFHGRDVDNLQKLIKIYKDNIEILHKSIKHNTKLMERLWDNDDDIAA